MKTEELALKVRQFNNDFKPQSWEIGEGPK
jgi:hypothetical protein